MFFEPGISQISPEYMKPTQRAYDMRARMIKDIQRFTDRHYNRTQNDIAPHGFNFETIPDSSGNTWRVPRENGFAVAEDIHMSMASFDYSACIAGVLRNSAPILYHATPTARLHTQEPNPLFTHPLIHLSQQGLTPEEVANRELILLYNKHIQRSQNAIHETVQKAQELFPGLIIKAIPIPFNGDFDVIVIGDEVSVWHAMRSDNPSQGYVVKHG